jgi:ribonuclease HI
MAQKQKYNNILVQCDGSSRGNPGPSGIGCVLYDQYSHEIIKTYSEYTGIGTNNTAEYMAIIKGIEQVLEYTNKKITIESDSLLVVGQISKDWKVSQSHLQTLHSQVHALLKKFKTWTITHIPREANSIADTLAKQASMSYA